LNTAETANLSVNASNGAGTQTALLTGNGVLPTYTVSPASIAFGNVQTNTSSAAQSVTVANTGTLAVPISSIGFSGTNSGGFNETDNCAGGVAAGSSCTINVVFTPSGIGSAAANLNVAGASGAGTQSIALAGSGFVLPPAYAVSPAALNFGNVQANVASAAQVITVMNTGTLALPITGIGLTGANAADFSETDTCAGGVAAGAACTIEVVFLPSAAAAESATLNVSGAGAAGTQSVALGGTGIVPAYTLTPAALPFGGVALNAASVAQAITVTNTGTLALPSASIGFSGSNAGDFSETDTCAGGVAVGATCTVEVVFTPSMAAAESASLTVNGAGGAAQSVALSGSGVAPAPSYSASPTSLEFGSVQTGIASAALVIMVTNTGSQVLPVSGISFSGVNAGAFSESDNCAVPVAAGASCAINVVFTPNSVGANTASLSINGGGGAATQIIALAGAGVPAPFWVYYNGVFNWPGDYSASATANYKDTTGLPLSGSYDINLTLNGPWGIWTPYAPNWDFNLTGFNYLVFSLKPTVANQVWTMYSMRVGDVRIVNSAGVPVTLSVLNYGPAPQAGVWATYRIPLADFMTDWSTGSPVQLQAMYKFGIQDETGLAANHWYIDNVEFTP
jgi:hypothetical protein